MPHINGDEMGRLHRANEIRPKFNTIESMIIPEKTTNSEKLMKGISGTFL